MKSLIAVPMFLLAAAASANCPQSIPSEAPAAPDGSTASYEVMAEAQTSIGTYVDTVEAYLDCWQPMLTSRVHNNLLDKAVAAAEAYNYELLRYRQREDLAVRD